MRKIQFAQQHDTRLPLTLLRLPRQQIDALTSHHITEGTLTLLRRHVRQGFTPPDQLANPLLPLGHQGLAAAVPFQGVTRSQHARLHCQQTLNVQLGGHEYARLALTTLPAQSRHGQPLTLLQAVDISKAGRAAIGQPVVRTRSAAALGDAIRVGQRQQHAMPLITLRIADRVGTRQPAQQALPLLHQPLGPLQRSAVYIRTARIIKQRKPIAEISVVGAAQQITFIHHSSNARRQFAEPQALPFDQHVRQPWVHRQASQHATMLGQLPVGAVAHQRAQSLQQLPPLHQRSGWRRVQPNQFIRLLHAPLGQLQRQRCQISLQHFCVALRR